MFIIYCCIHLLHFGQKTAGRVLLVFSTVISDQLLHLFNTTFFGEVNRFMTAYINWPPDVQHGFWYIYCLNKIVQFFTVDVAIPSLMASHYFEVSFEESCILFSPEGLFFQFSILNIQHQGMFSFTFNKMFIHFRQSCCYEDSLIIF